MELLKVGRQLIAAMHAEFESDGTDPSDLIDGWITNNYDLCALMWAAGVLNDAYDAVYEEVEQAIVEG